MPDNSVLLNQLANRAKSWHSVSGISQSKLARAIGIAESNYSSFLAGRTGIGSEATCLLLKYTAMNPRQALAAFSKPTFSASVLHLQERGKPLRFDNNGWTPKEGGIDDPNGTTDITGTSDAQRQAVENLLSVLAELDELTRQAVVGSIAKAYPNPYGTTAPNGQRFSRKRSR
jgi:transcriptional regulator with XRE-family HTH domain